MQTKKLSRNNGKYKTVEKGIQYDNIKTEKRFVFCYDISALIPMPNTKNNLSFDIGVITITKDNMLIVEANLFANEDDEIETIIKLTSEEQEKILCYIK